jgi:hypothetical protein
MEQADEHGNVVQRVVLSGDPKQPNQFFTIHVFHLCSPLYSVKGLTQTTPPKGAGPKHDSQRATLYSSPFGK